MKFGAYSNRIYKKKLNKNELDSVQNMLTELNDVKIKVYSDKFKGKITKLNTTYLKDNFDINTYYANMVIKKVNETVDSNKKLQQIYIDNCEVKINDKIEQIKVNKDKLDYWLKIRTNLYNIRKDNSFESYIKPFSFSKNEIKVFKDTYSFCELHTTKVACF